MIITTRSYNTTLYCMASSFFPDDVPAKRMVGYDHWTDAVRYLYDILVTDEDIVVNCDEDCFVYDWDRVKKLSSLMLKNGYSHMGMPETNKYHVGRNISEQVFNPFFNIFNVKKCQEALLVSDGKYVPPAFNFSEPFNEFFARLYQFGKPIPMKVSMHQDGISSVNEFLVHTWYGRNFGDKATKERILARYNEVK